MNEQPWERQMGESEKAWAAFQIYRDLGNGRSLSGVLATMQKPPGYARTLQEWSSKYDWVERSRAYDNYLDTINRAKHEALNAREYAIRINSYKNDTERTGRALLSLGARAITILQRQLELRLNKADDLTAAEIAALMRASCTAIDIGNKLICESLGIDKVDLSVTVEGWDENSRRKWLQ